MSGTELGLAASVFLACAVEAVEALTIVLAVGLTRGWRSAMIGVATACALLAVVVAALGPALTALPLNTLRLLVGGNGYMKAALTAPISMAGKHVSLQRLSSFGQWVNLVNLTLGTLNGRLFKPALYLPKGISHIRVFLSVNQAGNGLLSAQSGTQTVNRVK